MRNFFFICVLLCGCHVGIRVESSNDASDRVEVIKSLSRVYIVAFKNNEIDITYVHYLPIDPEAMRYSACVSILLPIKNRPNVLHNICVDNERKVVRIFVGASDGMTERHTCPNEKNHRMCLLMQYRFDWIYKTLDVERRVLEALYPEQTETEEEENEEID